jgi:hypothetical protein
MRHATSLLYHVCAVASRNIWSVSCGTSRKLTLWMRYVLLEFSLSAANMALGSTQLLTEMNTRNFPGSGHEALKNDNLTPSVSRLSRNYWSLDVSHTALQTGHGLLQISFIIATRFPYAQYIDIQNII